MSSLARRQTAESFLPAAQFPVVILGPTTTPFLLFWITILQFKPFIITMHVFYSKTMNTTRMRALLDSRCSNPHYLSSLGSIQLLLLVLSSDSPYKKKTTSYLTFSNRTGVIDARTEVIIGVGIDHRMQNRYWSAVLILMEAVDEVKRLIVPIGRWAQGAELVSKWVFIEGLRLSGRLC